jgi:hypothetical protein
MIYGIIVGGIYILISRVIAVFAGMLYGIDKIDGGESLQKYISISALIGVEGWMIYWSVKAIKNGVKYYESKRHDMDRKI